MPARGGSFLGPRTRGFLSVPVFSPSVLKRVTASESIPARPEELGRVSAFATGGARGRASGGGRRGAQRRGPREAGAPGPGRPAGREGARGAGIGRTPAPRPRERWAAPLAVPPGRPGRPYARTRGAPGRGPERGRGGVQGAGGASEPESQAARPGRARAGLGNAGAGGAGTGRPAGPRRR